MFDQGHVTQIVTVEVIETPLASRQAARLRGAARRAYDAFLDDLASQGCAALGYRVTGPEPLPRLCVKHLRGADRVVVAFAGDDSAWILIVGSYVNDPGRNVYNLLYDLTGARPPDDTNALSHHAATPRLAWPRSRSRM